jgi:hypothetical protein
LQIVGAEGMTSDELRAELEQGARVVVFTWVLSIVFMTITQLSAPYLVRPVEGMLGLRLRYAFTSMLLGWWGFPWGLIRTPLAIIESLQGGEDFTQAVLDGMAEERAARAPTTANVDSSPSPEPGHDPAAVATAAELDRLMEARDEAGARRLLQQTPDAGMAFGRERLRRVGERLQRAGRPRSSIRTRSSSWSWRWPTTPRATSSAPRRPASWLPSCSRRARARRARSQRCCARSGRPRWRRSSG